MKKISTFAKVLIILFLIIIIFLIVIPLFMKLSRDHENANGQELYENETEDISGGTVDGNITSYPALTEIPEYISNRGVILMGGYQQGASALFRKSPDGNLELARNYYNNCNLRVESSSEELVAFSEHFSDFGTPVYDENGTFASFSRPKYAFAIYRSDIYSMTELAQTLGDPMFELFPAFYDPSGKFIFVWETGFTYDDVMLPVLLKFLEPEMTEVKYERNGLGDGVEAIVTAPEDIDEFLDVMHSLELSLETEDHSVLAMAENRDVLTFTDINGKVNYYIFIGNYLIHGEDVYWIENSEKLDELETLFDRGE